MHKWCLVIYPSGRPNEVMPAICRAAETTTCLIDFVVALSAPEPIDFEVPESFKDRIRIHNRYYGQLGERTLVQIVNAAYWNITEQLTPQLDAFIGYWSDDFYPEPGWLEEFHRAEFLNPSKMFFQGNDVHKLTPHYPGGTVPFVKYRWYKENNGDHYFPPMYQRYGCDCDNALRATEQGVYQYVETAVVKHHHWGTGHREFDDLDKRGLGGHPWAIGPDWKTLYLQILKRTPVEWQSSRLKSLCNA